MRDSRKAVKAAWWQLTVEVPTQWADDASASLIGGGALGVQAIDHGAEPLPSFASHAVAPRRLPTRAGHTLLVASFPDDNANPTILTDVAREALGELGLTIAPDAVEVLQRDDSDWAERWKQYFKPIKIGTRMWIVPSWDTFVPPTGSVSIQLDPGMAFGTGQHATTALCLRAVQLYAEPLSPPTRAQRSMLDLGCGTGILAIGAAKLGFGRVLALDNDPEAVAAARDNIAANGVAAVAQVADTALQHINDRFDFVVANILAQPLIDLSSLLVRRLAKGGVLVLSGILSTQADDVINAYDNAASRARLPLRHTQRWTHGEWVALAWERSE